MSGSRTLHIGLSIVSSIALVSFGIINGIGSAAADVLLNDTINLSDNPSQSSYPIVAADGNNVYVAWIEAADNQYSNYILFKKTNDNGTTFGDPVDVNGGALQNSIEALKILVIEENIYLMWDTTEGIYFSSSSDVGETFEAPVKISSNGNLSDSAQLAADGLGHVYVTWHDNIAFPERKSLVVFASSSDNGATFGQPITLSPDGTQIEASSPQVGVLDGKVHVAWTQYNTTSFVPYVVLSSSSDNGLTFSQPTIISPQYSADPRMSISGGHIYIVWHSNVITFTQSSDNGLTFTPPKGLSFDYRTSEWPSLVGAGDSVYVTWLDSTERDIYFASSNDAGETFISPIDVSLTADLSSGFPFTGAVTSPGIIAGKDDAVYLAWVQFGGAGGLDDLYMSSSGNSGKSFSSPTKLGNYTTAYETGIASSQDHVYTTWGTAVFVNNSGNGEIFFRSGLLVKIPDVTPPSVTITFSSDGEGNPIEDGTTTLSGSAYFEFSASDDTGIDHIKCTLVSGSSSNENSDCTSPVFFSGLAPGAYELTVEATDFDGNSAHTIVSYTIEQDAGLDTDAPEVTITSAVDGNGDSIIDSLMTGSDSVTFGFDASDNVGVDHFDCFLFPDGGPLVSDTPCTSPISYNGLAPGSYQFIANATDAAGNEGIAILSFTISAHSTTTIDDIVSKIGDTGLQKNVKSSLLGPLKEAQKLLSDGNPNNDQSACNKLTAFMHIIDAKEKSGKLSAEQADVLRQMSEEASTGLGC